MSLGTFQKIQANGQMASFERLRHGAANMGLGQPIGAMANIIAAESGWNPHAQNPNSSAGGLAQFIDSTWSQYGGGNKFDPMQQIANFLQFTADNIQSFVSNVGRQPDAAEIYASHFGGAGVGNALGKMLDSGQGHLPISSVLSSEQIAANSGIEFNGKSFSQLTVGEFHDWAASKADPDGTANQVAEAGRGLQGVRDSEQSTSHIPQLTAAREHSGGRSA